MLVNIEADESEIAPFLDPLGWRDGLTVAHEPVDLGTVAAATVIAAITTPGRLEDLDDLYVERYGRSFYVERDESESWDAERVMGRPQAEYRLRVTPGDEHSLLTIQIMSDREGKCGAAQLVHAMNVMCGFEESLGIPDRGSGKTRL